MLCLYLQTGWLKFEAQAHHILVTSAPSSENSPQTDLGSGHDMLPGVDQGHP